MIKKKMEPNVHLICSSFSFIFFQNYPSSILNPKNTFTLLLLYIKIKIPSNYVSNNSGRNLSAN